MDSSFQDAAWNDVSLIFFSGRGRAPGAGGHGIVLDNEALSLANLFDRLNQTPGRVVLMSDCCFSGEFITDNTLNPERFSVLCAASEDQTTFEINI